MAVAKTAGLELIPGYRLVAPLGQGGFGEVWKCEAPGGLFKAIKFVRGGDDALLHRDVSCCEQELRSFNLIKTVRHPFIVSIERVEIVAGELVIIMELADRSLHDLLVERRQAGRAGLPRGALLAYLKEAAEALDVIGQEYGLQHLDVKPRNLFLLHGHVKVGDFGLVSSLADLYSGTLNLGALSPLYTAPEVFVGRLAPASDQYSLAVAYHELLTGAFPFDGKNFRQLALQHSCQPPDLRLLPEEDRTAVGRALAKAAGERYPSCAAFVEALLAAGGAGGRMAGGPDGWTAQEENANRTASLGPTDHTIARPPSHWTIQPSDHPTAQSAPELPGLRPLECVGRSAAGEVWTARDEAGGERLVRLLPGPCPAAALARLRALRHPVLAADELLVAPGGRLAVVAAEGPAPLADGLRALGDEAGPDATRAELLGHLAAVARCLDDLEAAEGLHHLTLSPASLVLARGAARLRDFGLAELVWLPAGVQPATLNGTYAPPELFAGKAGPTSDQYSLALVYLELLTGRPPAAPQPGRPVGFDLDHAPPADRPALLRALSIDPDRRFPTCSEFVQALAAADASACRASLADTQPRKATPQQLAVVLGEVLAQTRGELQVRAAGDVRYLLRPGRSVEHRCLSGLLPTALKVRLHAFRAEWGARLVASDAHGSACRVAVPAPPSAAPDRAPALFDVAVRFSTPEGGAETLTPVSVAITPVGGADGAARRLEEAGPPLLDSLRRHLQARPERRREERLPFPHTVRVTPVGEDGGLGEPTEAVGLDISQGGMRLRLASAPPTEALLIELAAPGDVPVGVPARVVRSETRPDGVVVGARFCHDAGRPAGVTRRRAAVPRSRRLLPAAAACLAALAGLALALPGAAPAPRRDGPAALAPEAAPECPPVRIEGRPGGFATLAEALAAADDGATVTVHARGLATPPLSCRGKALTIRAAAGCRPRLLLRGDEQPPWRALLDTDADLTLEGLSLAHADARGSPMTLLVHSAGGA
jgi:serine/threonine protein kinase